jgi:hypothetical protein
MRHCRRGNSRPQQYGSLPWRSAETRCLKMTDQCCASQVAYASLRSPICSNIKREVGPNTLRYGKSPGLLRVAER